MLAAQIVVFADNVTTARNQRAARTMATIDNALFVVRRIFCHRVTSNRIA